MLGNVLVETPDGNIAASQGGVIQISFNGTDDSKATAELLAGYELQDAGGNRVSAANLADGTAVRISDDRNIDASGSGVIAQNIIATATGEISGLFVGRNIQITTPEIGLIVTYSQGPPVFGNGGGGPPIEIDPGTPPVIVSPESSSAPPPPPVTKADAPAADNATTVVAKTENQDDGFDDDSKNKNKKIALAQKVSRVTVILPPKTLSENQPPVNPL
jgi:hypothetical protein